MYFCGEVLHMKVVVDPYAGFCPGVTRAIRLAEAKLREGSLYCLGQIVHNEAEQQRLEENGLITIDGPAFIELQQRPLMFRAHGEPPSSYRIAEKNEVQLSDATCPVVLKLQAEVRKVADQLVQENGTLVIFGKENHPEVKALIADLACRVFVCKKEKDIKPGELHYPVHVYSQTTMSSDDYHSFCTYLSSLAPPVATPKIYFHQSICKQIVRREVKVEDFATTVDVLIFAGGRHSSNAAFLFEKCRKKNPASYFVSTMNEIQEEWFRDAKTVGVTGASSSPLWQLEAIAKYIRENTA
jgi:4-hydroxy-3-methylbut-2-enyl diphosphate reductase